MEAKEVLQTIKREEKKMAKYTESIAEILQYNKHPLEDLSNLTDIEAIALRTIFDGEGINAISPEYREQFVIGFCTHFFDEEICYSVRKRWKIKLDGKIYSNANYINSVFENLDKQLFADYRVKKVTNSGNTTDTKSFNGTQTNTKETTSATSDNDIKENTKSGSESRVHGGTDTDKKEGAEYKMRAGEDYFKKEGSELTKNMGQDTNNDFNFQDSVHSNATNNYTNGVQIQSDTPMGSLENLRTPEGIADTSDIVDTMSVVGEQGYRELDVYGLGGGENPQGAGQGYPQFRENNYMSFASENDQTVTDIDNGNEQVVQNNKNYVNHGHEVLNSYGVREIVVQQEEEGQEPVVIIDKDERKDTTHYGSTDSTTYGFYVDDEGHEHAKERKDTREYNNDEVTVYGKRRELDTREGHEGEYIYTDDPLTDRTTDSASHSSIVNDNNTQMTANAETALGEHQDETEEIDTAMNWEMLYQSIPLLDKVWGLFDDLFMWVY